jgi:hypothetical protein
LGFITLPPVNLGPNAPVLNSIVTPTNSNPLPISDSAVANSIIHIYVNGVEQTSISVDAAGAFSTSIALFVGDNTVYAIAQLNSDYSPAANILNINLVNSVNNARLTSLAWLAQNQQGDGSWRDADGSTYGSSTRNSSAVVTALINAGIKDGHFLNSALSFLQSSNPSSVDSIARQLFALDQAGIDVTNLANKLVKFQNGFGTWGAYPGYGSSFPDTPLALLALFRTDNFVFNSSTARGPLCDGFLYGARWGSE